MLGMLVGVILLLALNLVRIISLYYIDVHFPHFFDVAHEQFWGIIEVLASVFLYAGWIAFERRDQSNKLDATI